MYLRKLTPEQYRQHPYQLQRRVNRTASVLFHNNRYKITNCRRFMSCRSDSMHSSILIRNLSALYVLLC